MCDIVRIQDNYIDYILYNTVGLRYNAVVGVKKMGLVL